MKRLFILLAVLSGYSAVAQQTAFTPKITLKWAPTGIILGNIALLGEYNLGKNSLTAKIGIPVTIKHSFDYDGNDAEFNMKATSFLAGYRTYLSKKKMKGLYFEPYFKYVHQNAEGTGISSASTFSRQITWNFTNTYDGFGVGAQLGAQFIIGKRFTIDLFFLGPEINTAKNNLKAVEASNTLPWTDVEVQEAEQDIKDFIDNFLFIRNRTTVVVDKNNKTVTANFKGALPGFRAGVSFGIAL